MSRRTRLIIDIVLIIAIVFFLCILPPYVENMLSKDHPYVIDCNARLAPWQARLEYVEIDHHVRLKCKST